MSLSRGSVRSVEDNHLMQEVKEVDVFHSETATNNGAPLERWQMVGMTSVPLKQEEDQQQKKQSSSEDDGFNHDQPKGKSAEALMLYLNGSRSHPVALIDDRRVRPYGMAEGSGAAYAPDGSEQMLYFKKDGTYLVSLNGKSVQEPKGDQKRSLVTGHVTKKMQSHDGEKVKDEKDYKHEGDKINSGIRYSENRIEFVADDQVVGYYDKSSETWYFKGKVAQMEFSDKIERTAPKITETVTDRFQTVGKTVLGIDSKDEDVPIGETGDVAYKKTYVKLA
jgi:phage gp45-like